MSKLWFTGSVAVALTGAIVAVAPATAVADTISISPTKGPVGTVISFSGSAPSCSDRAEEDAEVFFLIGNFAGNSAVNPRLKVETDDSGAFSGTFPAPDPLSSADPRAPRAGVKTYEVSVRCLGADGEHSGGAIVSDPPKFTFTDLVPVARCDVYWVKPGRTLRVTSRGVLANDYDPRGLSFRGHLDRVSFAPPSNSYSFNGRTGALRFKPGPKTTRAVFTYHITNSRQVESRRTKITVYVQPHRPSVRQLNACKGSR